MKILKLNIKNSKKTIKIAIDYIKRGEIIVFPTDTVYGIICDATKKTTVDKVFKIKNRSKNKYFPIFIKNIKSAKKIAKINKFQEKFLKKMWPGKITVVLEKKPSRLFGVNKKTIALRVPKYKPLNLLLEKINTPLVQTSTNFSGKSPLKSVKEIENQFKHKKYRPDLIIDAGKLSKSKPSKIIDLTISPPKILR